MKEITNREDVVEKVTSFYSKISVHSTLGPIFDTMLPTDEVWEVHLESLIDFWETNLFHVIKFKGNPWRLIKGRIRQTDTK
jgi:hemoglobin